jgi:hypothetical protein
MRKMNINEHGITTKTVSNKCDLMLLEIALDIKAKMQCKDKNWELEWDCKAKPVATCTEQRKRIQRA